MKILVTGASGGIGSTTASLLKDAGHEVVETTTADTDLTSVEAVRALKERVGQVDWIAAAHGYIDTEMELERQNPEEIERTFAVNTLSLFWLVREFGAAHFIALSSSAGLQPNGRYAAYSASKAAVNAFMQAMARNRPEQQFFALCPGPTNTAMRERIAHDAAKQQSPEVVARVAADIIGGSSEYKSGDVILIKNGVVSISSRVSDS